MFPTITNVLSSQFSAATALKEYIIPPVNTSSLTFTENQS